MNSKAKGTRNEHRSIKLLEAAGYACTRAAASLGVFDIVGIGSTDVVLVQVKTRDWPGAVEMEQLKMFVRPQNCRVLVHRWRDRQRTPDVKEIDAEWRPAPGTLAAVFRTGVCPDCGKPTMNCDCAPWKP